MLFLGDPDSSSVLPPLASLLALSVNCCVSFSHWLAAVNMWLVQSPELEGTKSLMELLLAQQRAEGVGWVEWVAL